MRSLGSSRALAMVLVGLFVLAMFAALASWAEARGRVPEYAAQALTGCLVALGAVGWLFLRRSAREIATAVAAIAPLQAQVDKANARIKEISISQGRFVGNIAHEIKTPLTTVLSQTELLLGCCHDPAAIRGYAKSIAEDMRHLSDLVEGFLRLAHPFAQEDTSNHAPVDLHDFVVEAVRRSRSMARECGVSVVPTLAEPDGDALEVLGDAALLEAMVENLVRNAVRFSRRGSQVELRVEVHGETIALFVRDHGTGIAAEHLESVFDWFFRSPGVTLQSSGTGFGLAIAKRVAEHHRGTIALRNIPAGGCEFEIQLPRWRAQPQRIA